MSGRPPIYGPPTPHKNYLKAVICRRMLIDFCARRLVNLDDLLGGDRSTETVKARAEFCILTGQRGIGANTVAKVLNTSIWTVQYWRNESMRSRKLLWNNKHRERHKVQRLAKKLAAQPVVQHISAGVP